MAKAGAQNRRSHNNGTRKTREKKATKKTVRKRKAKEAPVEMSRTLPTSPNTIAIHRIGDTEVLNLFSREGGEPADALKKILDHPNARHRAEQHAAARRFHGGDILDQLKSG